MSTKNFMTLDNLTTYDGLIKQYVGEEDAKSIKYIRINGNTVSFYKTEDGSGAAAYTIEIPDVSGFMEKIASGTGGKMVVSTANGEVVESNTELNDLASAEYVGEIPAGASSTTVVGYIDEAIDDTVESLATVTDVTIASQSNNVVTIVGSVKEENGVIETGTESSITLEEVAVTGTAADVSIVDSDGYFTATDVEGALAELGAGGGASSKTIYCTTPSSQTYAAVYKIYQGDNGTAVNPDESELKVTINIPKDQFLNDADLVNITYSNGKLWDGDVDVTEIIMGSATPTAADAGQYIRLVFELEAQKNPIYLKVDALVAVYTGGTTDESTVVIDGNNVITVNINKILATKVLYQAASPAVYTQVESGATFDEETVYYTESGGVYTVDSTVTAANFEEKIAEGLYVQTSPAVSEQTIKSKIDQVEASIGNTVASLDANITQTAGADGLALNVTEVDGVITNLSGSIASNTYEPYGTVSTAIAALDASESQSAGADGLALSITEVNGVITDISGSIAANTYEPYGIGSIADADIEALFSNE